MKDTTISDSIFYVGADDTTLDLFESQYIVPEGVSYNSYVIMDDKITIMDTVDQRATEEWIANVKNVLKDKTPAYLVVSHMEPDHAANIQKIAEMYPEMKIIGNAKTFSMMPQFFDFDLSNRSVVVKEGEEISLGAHTLQFFMAPMVHWPEVMVTYEKSEKILFSADGFGKFGALSVEADWACEARRYYFNIVGKYGGAAFVLIYLAFLLILGLPIMVMEFSVGRASKVSAALSFDRLEPKGTKWHWYKYGAMAGNYLLMMFYTTIAGWMVQYFIKMMTGEFEGKDTAAVAGVFSDMLAKPGTMTFFMIIVVVGCFAICGMGLQNGVEKITKVMMLLLLALMLILAVRSVTLNGASEGLRFYLAPDFHKVVEYGLFDTIFAAMGQAFFTLSLGIGAIAIFGSYIDKSRSLTGEAVLVTLLDTFVALIADRKSVV